MPIYDKIATPLTPLNGLDQQAFTTTTNGEGIPLKGIVALAWFFLCNAYVSGTMTFKIQVSADDITYVDLDEKHVINPTAEITAIDQIVSIGINGLDLEDQIYARIVTLGAVDLSGYALVVAENDNR